MDRDLTLLFSILAVSGICLVIFLLGISPSYIAHIIIEGGNVSRLDIHTEDTATYWAGVYGNLTEEIATNSITLSGSSVSSLNIYVRDINFSKSKNVYFVNSSSMSWEDLIPGSPSELDVEFDLNGTYMSASQAFDILHTFTIYALNVTYELNATRMSSSMHDYYVGLLKENTTGRYVFVSNVIDDGLGYDSSEMDYQTLLPVQGAETYHAFPEEYPYCELNVSLVDGQNWFSVPCRYENSSPVSVFSSIASGAGVGNDVFYPSAGCTGNASDDFSGNYSIIWSYNASDSADPWRSYDPTQNCFAIPSQDLQSIVIGANYQITMTANDTLVIINSTKENVVVPLVPDQNWIGYPSNQDRNISAALMSLGSGAGVGNDVFYPSAGCTGNASDDFSGNYSIVWSYNASDSADPWKSYDPTQNCFALPSQDLQKMVPGAGYQITMTNADVWVVDWN